jgi:hypothetical protein
MSVDPVLGAKNMSVKRQNSSTLVQSPIPSGYDHITFLPLATLCSCPIPLVILKADFAICCIVSGMFWL